MIAKFTPPMTPVNREFWDGTGRGELRARLCRACDARFRFVSNWCPRCWSADIDFVALGGGGRVFGFSVVYRALLESFADSVPYVVALVQLDDGPAQMGNIIGCDPEAVHVDMRVRVTFEPRGPVMLPQFMQE